MTLLQHHWIYGIIKLFLKDPKLRKHCATGWWPWTRIVTLRQGGEIFFFSWYKKLKRSALNSTESLIKTRADWLPPSASTDIAQPPQAPHELIFPPALCFVFLMNHNSNRIKILEKRSGNTQYDIYKPWTSSFFSLLVRFPSRTLSLILVEILQSH